MTSENFQQQILNWFDSNGRKNLPWQQNITPYRVWVSEIMLQQTQVTTVIPYFKRFIQAFPDIMALAAAPLDSVLNLWAGLGYYARARNLHKAAIIIAENHRTFPNDLDLLMDLPGIGRSTAGAILSIAFNNSHPILDGNVKRVLARYQSISGWTGHTRVSKELWKISAVYTPIERCADYTQAMMDLGATLCVRSKPKCHLCPLSPTCRARIENSVNELPTPKPAKTLPEKKIAFLMLQNIKNQILLEKRPASGIWGGLWSFPEFTTWEDLQLWCLEKNIQIQSVEQLSEQRHTFSHYHLDYTVFFVRTNSQILNLKEANQAEWYGKKQLGSLGLPAPINRILQNK